MQTSNQIVLLTAYNQAWTAAIAFIKVILSVYFSYFPAIFAGGLVLTTFAKDEQTKSFLKTWMKNLVIVTIILYILYAATTYTDVRSLIENLFIPRS